MGDPKISIIIVNWNGLKWLRDCFDSIHSQTYENLEVILVDNGSSDESITYIQNNFSDTIIIKNEKNLGFGLPNNIGHKNATGEILFFLNNDTRFENSLLDKLVDFKNKNNLNIVSPRILNENKKDSLDGNNISIDFLGYPIVSKNKFFYIEGCSMMISKEDFKKIGGFDEKYFMYAEDIDLCWRAQLLGMKIGICEDARITHFGGGSSEKTMLEENKKHTTTYDRRFWTESHTLRNLLKNYSLINLLWVLPIYFFQNISESLFYLIIGNSKMFKVIWKSFYWNAKLINDTINKRRSIQKQRTVSDLKILNKMSLKLYKPSMFLKIGIPNFK